MNINKRPRKKVNLKIDYRTQIDLPFLHDFQNVIKPDEREMDYYFYNVNKLVLRKINKKQLQHKSSLAEYDIYNNKIYYLDKEFKYGIMHELFHLSSTVRTTKRIYTGFAQFDLETCENIGLGLTEGYTCILDERYFKDYAKNKVSITKNTYSITKQLASLLEELVTKELMEELYFKADLYGLVEYLNQYMPYENCINFIKALDNIFYYCDSVKIPNVFVSINNFTYAINFIGRCFLNIICEMYYNEEIDKNTFLYLKDMVRCIFDKKICFKGLPFVKSKSITDDEFDIYLIEAKKRALKNIPNS